MQRTYRYTSFFILSLNSVAALATTDYSIGGHIDNLIGNNLQLQLSASGCIAPFSLAVIPSTGDDEVDTAACASQCCSGSASNTHIGPTQTYCTCGPVPGRPAHTPTPEAVANTQTITVPIHATSFVFAEMFTGLVDYIVTVAEQPINPKLTCKVTAGVGALGLSNVTNIVVSCVDRIFKNGFDP